jgi:hypothetical protein
MVSGHLSQRLSAARTVQEPSGNGPVSWPATVAKRASTGVRVPTWLRKAAKMRALTNRTSQQRGDRSVARVMPGMIRMPAEIELVTCKHVFVRRPWATDGQMLRPAPEPRAEIVPTEALPE